MSFLPVIINILCGAVGGNVAGTLFKKINLGTLGNSLAGIVGGGLGGQLLAMIGMTGGAESATEIGAILQNVGAGGVGGGVVLAIVGAVKSMMTSGKQAS